MTSNRVGVGILVTAFLLVPGCTSFSPEDPAPEVHTDAAEGVVVLSEVDTEFRYIAGTCGSPIEIERRPDATVSHPLLRFTVRMPSTTTGLQLGYSVDDGGVEWLPLVSGREQVTDVPAPEDTWEDGEERWSFFFRHNVGTAPTDCDLGGGTGVYYWRIEAIAAES